MDRADAERLRSLEVCLEREDKARLLQNEIFNNKILQLERDIAKLDDWKADVEKRFSSERGASEGKRFQSEGRRANLALVIAVSSLVLALIVGVGTFFK